MKVNILCINERYRITEIHWGAGYLFGTVSPSCCDDSRPITTTSWSIDGVCLTDKKYNVRQQEIYLKPVTVDYPRMGGLCVL